MKKIINSTDIHQKQGQELAKKLYRTTSERAKRLDDARSCARTISDLFTPNLHIQRRKFCEYCERLIFSDPILYGKKVEELLWRKGYYDVVSQAKKLKKKEYSQSDICNLITHITAGVGFYHHFIARLQYEFNLDLRNIIDFPLEFPISSHNNNNNNSNSNNNNNNNNDTNGKGEIIEWAMLSIHQCLIYLGDLTRYKLEIDSNYNQSSTLVYRYYLQAITFKPDHGMPHNQMGTLAMNRNNFLDAVYHYMRCLACNITFDGTVNNLHSLFDKNSKYLEQLPIIDKNTESDNTTTTTTDKIDLLKRFISRFLLLIDIWYFNKKVNKVYDLCHQTYKDLEECLQQMKITNDTCESPTENETNDVTTTTNLNIITTQITNDMLFKIIVICLLCISKLQKLECQQISTAVAFTLAIYSQLVQNVCNHIQESVLNYPLPDIDVKIETTTTNGIIKDILKLKKKKRNKSKIRRRKALKIESDSDSDDDNKNESESSDEDDDDDSFTSDLDNVLAESSDDDDAEEITKNNTENNKNDKTNEENNTKNNVFKKVQRMDVNDMLEIISEETSLQSIKILNDWLMQETDIMKSCGTNTRSLLRQVTNLLNLININLKSTKLTGIDLDIDYVIKNSEKIPICEDIVLKGVEMLNNCQKNIDWNFMHRHGMTIKEESVIRIIKLMAFGKFLTNIEETGIVFEENDNLFVCKEQNDDVKPQTPVADDLEPQELADNSSIITNKEETDSKGQLMKMKHMGQLWLASEVRALETRVKGKTSLSPYLVLDTDALIKYTFMVKHLVHSRKFIVLIPSAVVSALDDLKREQSEARDAIRWLESQFHRGNRFFRAQRPQEKASIPFIKYPKKKDKEMCIYIDIIECCYFLAEQQKGASNLVTLLIGNQNVLSNGENKDFSYVGLAQSAGVSIEAITLFYSKWKKNYKGKR